MTVKFIFVSKNLVGITDVLFVRLVSQVQPLRLFGISLGCLLCCAEHRKERWHGL